MKEEVRQSITNLFITSKQFCRITTAFGDYMPITALRYLTISILLCFCIFQDAARADLTSTGRFSTTVPCFPLMIGLVNTHLPLISVRVNNSVTATFVVDTGTNGLVVTNEFAKKMQLPLDATNQGNSPSTMYGRTVHTTTLEKIEIGKIVVKKQVMVVLPPGVLSGLGQSVDGILGSAFMTHIALLWDFHKHQLTFLIPSNLTPQELQSFGFSAGSRVTITHTR